MEEISFDNVMSVTESWDRVKEIPNYVQVLGEQLFLGLFQIEPTAMAVFQIDSHLGEDIASHPAFPRHAKVLVDMVDGAVDTLGPDMEMLSDALVILGRRHAKYGVKPQFLPSMGTALVHALRQVTKMDLRTQHAWTVVLKFMTDVMTMGLRQELEGQVESRASLNPPSGIRVR